MEAKLLSKVKYRTKVSWKDIMNITRGWVSRAKDAGGEKSALGKKL